MFRKFLRSEAGLITIEWVGIAAVMVLAAIAIAAYVMQGTEGAADNLKRGVSSVDASNPSGPGTFGNGIVDPVN